MFGAAGNRGGCTKIGAWDSTGAEVNILVGDEDRDRAATKASLDGTVSGVLYSLALMRDWFERSDQPELAVSVEETLPDFSRPPLYMISAVVVSEGETSAAWSCVDKR